MPTDYPDDPTDVMLDPALIAAVRARGQGRRALAEETAPAPEEKPPPVKRRLVVIAVAAAGLVVAGIAVVGLSEPGAPTEAMPTHSYLPGAITPAEDLPVESSASTDPMSASSALGLVPTTTTPPPAPPPPPVERAPSGAKTVTSGPGCGGYRSVGSYRDGRRGWVEHGDGRCGSAFMSVPMSGDARRDDSSSYAMWTFAAAGTCEVSVHVPDGDLTAVGGNPTVYFVYDRNGVGGAPVASFAIKQVDRRGQWVTAGRFRSSGTLTVQLLNRGQDWNRRGPTYAHHAAGAVKAHCTS
ncbi:hypothetical protein ACVDFE_32555 [Lentzea chajnantorensis]